MKQRIRKVNENARNNDKYEEVKEWRKTYNVKRIAKKKKKIIRIGSKVS